MTTTLGQYMAVTEVDRQPGETRKTRVWRVNDRHGGTLGTVSWYGRWRQYTFQATGDSIFNRGCLQNIDDFLRRANDDHREELRRR